MIAVMHYYYATEYPYNAGMSTVTELIAVYRSRLSAETKKATPNKHSMEELEKMMSWTQCNSDASSTTPIPMVKDLKPHLFSLIKKDSVKKLLEGQPLLFNTNTTHTYTFSDRTFAFLLLIIRKELMVYCNKVIEYVVNENQSDFQPKPHHRISKYDTETKEPGKSRKHKLSTGCKQVNVNNGITDEDIAWFNHAQKVATTARIVGLSKVPPVHESKLSLPQSLSDPTISAQHNTNDDTTIPTTGTAATTPTVAVACGFGDTSLLLSPQKVYSDSDDSDDSEDE